MNTNLIEVTLTPEQLKQLADEHKLTVSAPGGLFLALRINREDDGRQAVEVSNTFHSSMRFSAISKKAKGV